MADNQQSRYNNRYTDSNIYRTPTSDPSFYKKLLGQEEQYYKTRNKIAEKYDLENLKRQLKNKKISLDDRLKLEKELASKVELIEKDSMKVMLKWQENQYKKATDLEKVEINKRRIENINSLKEQADFEIELIRNNSNLSAEEKRKQISEQKSLLKSLSSEQTNLDKVNSNLNLKQLREFNNAKKKGITGLANWALKQDSEARKNAIKQTSEQNKKNFENYKNSQKKLKDLQEKYGPIIAEKKANGEDASWYESRLASAQAQADSDAAALNQSAKASMTAQIAEITSQLAGAFSNAVSDAQKQADDMMVSYQSRVNASLQGSGKDFGDLLDTVQKNLAISPVVQMEKVIDSIKEASDQGIAYNIEQRAFLNTVSDKIAHTFDAFDSNLSRLIRLQQADTTAARLGMEASLTKLFNSTFNDTSYLSDVYDTVSEAIIDANSQLDKNAAAEFEYTLQKWLGSLYSLGLSSSTVTQIAEGVNYLATGDVTSLASNTSLQTLMAMSASNAGLDFAEIMLEGLDAEATNKLLESMVKYLKDIAENSDNQVVKSAYGDIFNMSLSDMTAFSNMTSADISRISGTNVSYNNMMTETQMQLLQTVARQSLTESMNNIYQNALYGMGLDMAQNPATWTMDKMLDFMEANKIDINIPFVSVFGSGLDINASVVELLRMGLGLSGAMSLVGNVLGALGSGTGTGLSLSDWGGTEYNQRGTGIGGLLGTLIGGTSSSTYVNNSSSSDMSNDAIATATDDAEETKQITNKNAEKNDHQLDDFWNATVGEGATDFFKVQDEVLRWTYDSSLQSIRVFDKTAVNYMMSIFGQDSLNSNGRIKTIDSGIDSVRSSNYLRVQDTGLNNTLGFMTFDTSRALRTVITNSTITTRIANASDIGASIKSNSPTQMSLAPGTTVNINKAVLVQAIIEALGGNENNIKLKQFIEGSLQGTTGITPPIVRVRSENVQGLDVNVKNYQQFNT